MSVDNSRGKLSQAQVKQDAAERLAKALRDNLHRRKAQARARKHHVGSNIDNNTKRPE